LELFDRPEDEAAALTIDLDPTHNDNQGNQQRTLMKLLWQIEDGDIQKVRTFYEAQKKNAFVLNRIERNVKKVLPPFSNGMFWEAMISCLITTQQRSGPDSPVTKFICTKPFPLNYEKCKTTDNLQNTVEETITTFGGLRRGKSIGEEVAFNFKWLKNSGWKIVNDIVENMTSHQTPSTERKSAEIIIDNLKGFGPKQSRNLLQSLGLTKFEIPVDGRITKWLIAFGFPMKLSAMALADKNYYNFVLDGFQKICEASGIFPCVMDAAIFSSFDGEWPADKLIW
jgi:N-glycosylase/DNA lyase